MINSEDLNKFRNAYADLGRILGKLENQEESPTEIPSAVFTKIPGRKLIEFRPNGLTEVMCTNNRSQMVSNNSSEGDNMKYLTKRKDGRWQFQKIINGKRVYIYGKTQALCLIKVKQAQKKNFKTDQKRLDFYSFALWWLKTFKKETLSSAAYRNDSYIIQKHFPGIQIPLNQLKIDDLQKVLNNLPATRIRERVFQIMKEICKKAYQLEYLKKDISQFLSIGKIDRKQIEALTPSEQMKIVHALGKDNFSLRVMFYLLTGARPTEIQSIDSQSIEQGYIHIKGTKTGSAVRWVKVSDHFCEIFKPLPADFYKFDTKRFREHLQRFCEELGISGVTVYRLRHTFATNLFILGVPDKERQHYMGHTTSRMTNDVYTDFRPNISAKDIKDIYGDLYPDF